MTLYNQKRGRMRLVDSPTPELSEFEQKVLMVCQYLVEHRSTVRYTASRYRISHTTVSNYVYKHLERLDPELYKQAVQLIKLNSSDGGSPKGFRI
ncbi:transcriptional regulator [Bacillus phage SP-15]|uniref:Transcriptional regulator n=1 Tax=Bacillus phage SP-15 TaxID=1792032 RepID=A0A127AWW4_9CAUD|nr:sporulation stage III protein D [Bacillus phage SP-15]AMM45092.1 transcriptional regulator [Bacillus phage SP-15]